MNKKMSKREKKIINLPTSKLISFKTKSKVEDELVVAELSRRSKAGYIPK